jgi:hypothetical protein
MIELSAQALSRWLLRHLTHDGESRGERQARSSQNQENYLSCQLKAASDEKFSSATSRTTPTNSLAAELMSALSLLAASKLTAQVVL